MRRFWVVLVLLTVAVCPAMAAGYRTSVGTGADEIPVVVVNGTPYEMGYSYGSLMAAEVNACISGYLAYYEAEDPVRFSDANLDAAWAAVEPYVNTRFIEEMQGLADGAGIDYLTVRRAHSISLLENYACSGVALWGAASANGHLYQIRNLDYTMGAGVQNYPTIAVYLPREGVAHATVGFAGYIGATAGLSAAGIAVTEMGDTPGSEYPFDLDGVPFFVMLRDVLQDAPSLNDALTVISTANRIKKYHYVIGDGDEPAGVKIRAWDPNLEIWSDNDPADELFPNVLPNVVYETMHNDLAWNHLNANYGSYDAGRMIELSQLVHGGGNLMDVVYDATARQMWVAYAEGAQPAYQREYVHFNLNDYLAKSVSAPDRVACPGSTLALPISIDNPSLVAAAQIDLRYDPSILTAVSVEAGDLVAGDPHWLLYSQITSGRAQALLYSDEATALGGGGGGALFVVNFDVNLAAVAGQSSVLELRQHILSDSMGNQLPSLGVNGSVEIIAVHHFAFDAISSPQGGDPTNPLPFSVTISALDQNGEVAAQYAGSADLSDLTATVQPTTVGPFVGGIWTGEVAIATPRAADVLRVDDGAGALVTWDQAQAAAVARGGYLATTTSSAENEFIVQNLGGELLRCYWLGGYETSDSNWHWVTGEPWSYTNWYPGQPDGWPGTWQQGLMYNWQGPMGTWNDHPRAGYPQRGYVVEWDSVPLSTPLQWSANGHWYQPVAVSDPYGISWADASAEAAARGGHLVTVTSAEENAFVFSLIDDTIYWNSMSVSDQVTDYMGPWIGAYLDGEVWRWVTGEPWDYTNWGLRGGGQEPIGDGPYVQYYSGPTDGRSPYWNDCPDYTPYYPEGQPNPQAYVIEWETNPGNGAVQWSANGHWYRRIDVSASHAGESNAFDVVQKGDARPDFAIDVLDVMKTVNIILGNITPAPWQYWAADVNSDGEVNVQDIILIINRIFDVTPLSQGKLMAMTAAAQPSGQPVVVGASWSTSASGTPVLAITLDDATGVAGVQLDVSYGRNKGTTVAAFAGDLIAAAPGWSVYARDLGGLVRVLGFNGSAQGLPGGAGSIVVLELAGAKGKSAKLESIQLVDGAGNVIPSQIGAPGRGKGRR